MKFLRACCFRIVMEVLVRVPGIRKLVFWYPIWDQLGEELPLWEERLLVRLGKRYREKFWFINRRACWVRYGYVIINEFDSPAPHRAKGRPRLWFTACLSGTGGDLLLQFPTLPGDHEGGEVFDTKEEAERILVAQILGGME